MLNKLFLLTLISSSYWAFCEFMMRQAPSIDDAFFWNKISFLIPFLSSLLLHFALVFTNNPLSKRKFTYALLYLPALAFSLLDLTTNLLSAPPVLEYWGYSVTFPTNSWLSSLNGVFSASFSFLCLLLCIKYYVSLPLGNKKQQVKYVTLGLSFLIFLSVTTDSIFPVAGIKIPGLTNISSGFLIVFIAYAMAKYRLFTLNTAVAAETIISAIPDSLILADMTGTIIQFNKKLENLLGYPYNFLVGKNVTDFLAKPDSCFEAFRQLKEKGVVEYFETTLKTKSGLEKNVAFSGSVVKDKTGNSLGVTLIVHDVTYRKFIEERLVKAERFASIGELAGMVGHDLRNPLTSITGATYYLKSKYADKMDLTGREMLATIEQSIVYSNKIVTDLLDYSRELRLNLETVSLKGLLCDVFGLVKVPVGVKVVDLVDCDLQVNVDVAKMHRVFANVVKNAFDAMPNGGVLTINCEKAAGLLEVCFSDTGEGMSDETLSKLWTPLFTTKAKGMGFGLSICKRIVEAHDGSIDAKS
ncbi:MAG: PAS domain S-box protein, partial [Crenarchaeota archaeon]|nr:PAS domain S-box protein [Thermoproteota archaeon]